MAIASVNPATGETIKTFEALNDAAIDAALARSSSAFAISSGDMRSKSVVLLSTTVKTYMLIHTPITNKTTW